jgi:hypothetical protein
MATSSDHCRIAVAALDASVRPFSEQPLAMELACVNKLATRDGKIYVDARFTSGQTLEEPNVSICSTDRYVTGSIGGTSSQVRLTTSFFCCLRIMRTDLVLTAFHSRPRIGHDEGREP